MVEKGPRDTQVQWAGQRHSEDRHWGEMTISCGEPTILAAVRLNVPPMRRKILVDHRAYYLFLYMSFKNEIRVSCYVVI